MEELLRTSKDRPDDQRAGQRVPALPEGREQARLDAGRLQKQFASLLMSIDCVNKVSHALAYVTASKNGVSEPEIEDFISLDDKVGENIRSDRKLLRTSSGKVHSLSTRTHLIHCRDGKHS